MAALWLYLAIQYAVSKAEVDVALLAAEAAVSAKVRQRRSGVDVAPYDISELCWAGGADQSKERCCQGDATTHAECWDESYSFEECCPNADCWDGDYFTYEACCDQKHGENGNAGCWSGYYDYEHCCLANRSSQSWVDIILREIDTDQFYGMDEFYTDAQYGKDFGYYSTGRVLGKSNGKSAQEFAHYTTYPMALSPHFGRVVCRLVFIMWIQMKEKAPFRVVEMGAGSGQLAHDLHICVKRNELGIDPPVWRRFVGAFEYVIVEKSPALERRQRQRGLKVVSGDAQRKDSCPSILKALALSDACSVGSAAPECKVAEQADKHTAASVVLSNELLDAFEPVKLQLSIYGQPVVTHCRAWQEVRLVHIMKLKDLEAISQALQHSEERIRAMAIDLEGYTNEVFCRVTNTSVGKAAMACAPTSSCLGMVIALSEIMNHHDLHLPAAAHNMRLRLRKDAELCQRLKQMVSENEEQLQNSVVLPRQVYRMLRHQLRDSAELEVHFLTAATTRQVPVPLSEERCEDLRWWFEVHEARIQRLIDVYRPLAYPNIQLLVRPGERNFVELADCLVGKEGFMLAVDYGATFETLHDRLQSILEADEQTESAVEVIRQMTEALLWGEQNDDNDNFFDFFCEKSILSDFVRILGRNVPKTVKVQLLQSLSMLIQNIRRPTSLYYLFSNNYVNQLIATQFDWSDEEILSYYISFLKSLALRLNQETIKFFFNERSQQFPLFTEAIRFFSHHDQMVRTSVRTLTLRVFSVDDEAMQKFVLRISRPYFQRLSEYLGLLWHRLEEARGSPALDEASAEQQDLVMYICDVLDLNNEELNLIVVQKFLAHACYPFLLHPLSDQTSPRLVSCRTALFLLHEIFQNAQRRDIAEPLAAALLGVGNSDPIASPQLPEIVEVWEPFVEKETETSLPQVNLRAQLLNLLKSEEALLAAGLLRSCLGLGMSNLLPQELLVDAGLLPPSQGYNTDDSTSASLEVLQIAAEALENHSSLNMVVVQGLCRLCMDVAFTPQARSLSDSKRWRERPMAAIAKALQSAAQQVRAFIYSLGDDAFLDLFAEAWELDHEADQLPDLCSRVQLSLARDEPRVSESDSQQAFKAVRVMLMLRRLSSDLSEGGGSPRHRPEKGKRSWPEPVGGGIIDSALAPLSGAESPLQIPEEEFNTLEGGTFQLGRMDRIVCGIVTPEGRHSRFMLLHHHLLLLVLPDMEKHGWATVKTVLPLRHVEPKMDSNEPRQLRLHARSPEEPGETSVITLTFEDSKRCSVAEHHLTKYRKQAALERLKHVDVDVCF
eukprot:symbB.v1.2.019091.t1/scaffold1550.1/size112250/1